MTQRVEDIDRGWKKIMAEMKKKPRVIDVGIIGTEAEREPEALVGEFTTNAAIASFHEFGTAAGGSSRSGGIVVASPERSFIRSTIDEKHSPIAGMFAKVARAVLGGKTTQKTGFGLIGEKVVSWIKAKIRKGIPPALMPSTIDARRRQFGKASSKPLIATGQLMGSITYAVRGIGEGDK
jgi:hypothetical protein